MTWLLNDDKNFSLEEASSRKQEVVDAFISTSEIWNLATTFYPIDIGDNYELKQMESAFYSVVNNYQESLKFIGEFVINTPGSDSEQISSYEIYQNYKNQINYYSQLIDDFNCNF